MDLHQFPVDGNEKISEAESHMVQLQHDLFSSAKVVQAMDKEVTPLKLSLEQPPRTELEINLSIIRGFISLYFDGDPANIIHRPLDRLNGKTLYFMAGRHFDVVRAWMKEISRHPEERNRYVESKLLSK